MFFVLRKQDPMVWSSVSIYWQVPLLKGPRWSRGCNGFNSQQLILQLLQEGESRWLIFTRNQGGQQRLFNTIVSDISPRLTGQYIRDQAISLELVAMVFDFTLPLLTPVELFVTKIFQGIEGIVNAAKQSDSLGSNGFFQMPRATHLQKCS